MLHNLLSGIPPWAHSLMYLTRVFPKKSQECVLACTGDQVQKVGRTAPMTVTVPRTRNAVITAVGNNAAHPTKVNIRGWGVLCNITLSKCAYHVGWGLTAALQVWIRLATFLHVFLPLILPWISCQSQLLRKSSCVQPLVFAGQIWPVFEYIYKHWIQGKNIIPSNILSDK